MDFLGNSEVAFFFIYPVYMTRKTYRRTKIENIQSRVMDLLKEMQGLNMQHDVV